MNIQTAENVQSKSVALKTALIVALITYFPTIAEILVANHVTLFSFFVPFI